MDLRITVSYLYSRRYKCQMLVSAPDVQVLAGNIIMYIEQ